MTDKIEIMAEAVRKAGTDYSYSTRLSVASSAIAALEANGFAIVPVEPTEAMIEAFDREYSMGNPDDGLIWSGIKDGWAAAIAAGSK